MNIRDLLYGVAVGDAVGNPLEFKSTVTQDDAIESMNSDRLNPSDDTQMSLFLAEALSSWGGGNHDLAPTLERAYVRWLRTQNEEYHKGSDGGLLRFKSLYAVEAPGRTCMNSAEAIHSGIPVVNDSKGNGTVMRCAPIALYGHRRRLLEAEMLHIATVDALVTHKHPYAAISSGFQVLLLDMLLHGLTLPNALREAGCAISCMVERSHPVVGLAQEATDIKRYYQMRDAFGGWVAEEALALAIGSVMHSYSYEEAIVNAVTISGDSDTVAAIAGAIAVCSGKVPLQSLQKKVTLSKPIDYISRLPFWSE